MVALDSGSNQYSYRNCPLHVRLTGKVLNVGKVQTGSSGPRKKTRDPDNLTVASRPLHVESKNQKGDAFNAVNTATASTFE